MESAQDSRDEWRYVIVLTKFIIQFVEVATTKSFGVLIPTMMYIFSTDTSSLGLVCSLPTSMMLLGSLPVAYILKSGRLSPRMIAVIGAVLSSLGIIVAGYLTSVTALGICMAITGFGLSMGYLPVKVLLNDYFQDTFILMNAIGNLGSTAGALVVPVIVERALQAYGFSGAMLILGGISLHAIAASIAMRTPKEPQNSTGIDEETTGGESTSHRFDDDHSVDAEGEITVCSNDHLSSVDEVDQHLGDDIWTESSEEDTLTLRQRLRRWFQHCIITEEPLLLLSLSSLFLTAFVVQAWILFLVPRAMWHGIPRSKAVLLSSIGGGGGIFGRLLSVVLLYCGADFIIVYLILSIVSSVTFLLDPLLTWFPIMCVSAFIQGICVFSAPISGAAFLKGSVSNENFTVAAGVFALVYGIGGNVGSLLAGMIKDRTGSYTIVFLALGFISCVSVSITIAFVAARRKRDGLSTKDRIE